MADQFLLDATGRRILLDGTNANRQKLSSASNADCHCCGTGFYRARFCDATLSDVYMSFADGGSIASFKYSSYCYYFTHSDTVTTVPGGGTLITPASVTTYTSCGDCSPCGSCSLATSDTLTVTLSGVTVCPGQTLAPFANGTYTVNRIVKTPANPFPFGCQWVFYLSSGFNRDRIYLEKINATQWIVAVSDEGATHAWFGGVYTVSSGDCSGFSATNTTVCGGGPTTTRASGGTITVTAP